MEVVDGLTVAATDSIIGVPAEVAQVVEHGTENAGVDSSSLSLGTTPLFPYLKFLKLSGNILPHRPLTRRGEF